jgi:membrane protease YdiL (CAAX protease family)
MSKMISILRIVVPFLIYVGIFLGMHVAKSVWISILTYHLVTCIALTVVSGWGEERLFGGWKPFFGIAGVVICSILGPVIYITWPFMRLNGLDMGLSLEGIGLSGTSFVFFVFYFSTVNPVVEEIFWRGWYSKGKWPVISDILFAGYHLMILVLFVRGLYVLISFFVLLGSSFMWRLCVRRLGGLLVPILTHGVANLSIISAAFFMSR